MMNMIELQNKLKNFSQEQLVGMMQQPSGDAPQFMVLGEITRRQKMQQEATKAPTQSVAQEAVAAAGVPQGGIADMARTLAPQTNVAQNTGAMSAPPQGMPSAPQGIARMASGGVIKMQAAGKIDFARYRELARRLVSDGSFSPEELKELEQIQNSNEFDNALAIEADLDFSRRLRLANSESLSDINPALPRVESSAPTPVFDATVEVPSLNQAPAADTAIYGGGVADGVTYDSAAPSGLAALSPDTMPTVDGPFAYPESRFSTNLGPRAMLDWEEGQAEEAARIDARTNADLGSGRTPRYDTAIGPQPTSPQTETPIDLEAYLKSIYPDYGQEDARTNADLGSGRTPRYDTAIGPQPDPRGGLDIQSKINRLRAIIESNASPMERMQAAQELEKLNASVAMTQGYLAQQERTLPPGYIMTAMGMQLDPNYVAPGTTGNSIIDQTVTQGGSEALSTLPAGIQSMVDSALLKAAQNKANLTDFEKGVYPINQTKSTATDVLDNPFAPKDLKIEAQKVIDEAAKKTEALASKTGMNPELFSPRVLNETGYSGLTEYDPKVTPAAASVTPNIDNITDEELAKYTNKRPQPRPKDLFAPTTDNAREGGGSGTGSGSGGSSNYETKLLEMLSRQEANAKSDKWMALAQAGMSLMQGGTGSFGGDLGRAGQTGLAALQGSRASNDKSQLDILGAIENSKLKREAIAASAAKSTAPNATALKSVIENLDIEMAPLAARAATGKLTPDEKTQLDELKKQRNYYVNILGGLAGGGNGAYPASPTPKPPYDATKPPGIIGRGINAVRDAITG
jgi:hypothetical protein